jgi:hypothetical protein
MSQNLDLGHPAMGSWFPTHRKGRDGWGTQSLGLPRFQKHLRFADGRVWLGGALDEALREAEAGAEQTLTAGHLALVGLVVIAGQMQQAMQDEDFNLD